MTDDEFADAFLAGNVSPAAFHHRDHLRLAWCLVRRSGADAAAEIIADGIRRFATALGRPEKYHETLTRFWVRIVGYHIDADPEIASFDRFIEMYPRLLDKDLPYQHWRRATLQGDDARIAWIEPDMLALPA